MGRMSLAWSCFLGGEVSKAAKIHFDYASYMDFLFWFLLKEHSLVCDYYAKYFNIHDS